MSIKAAAKVVALFMSAYVLMSCASSRGEPIVDTKGIDPVAYNTDLAECRLYAEQVDVAGEAATGAAAGAVVGGVLGAVVGNSNTAQRGAGVGAVTGGLSGTGRGFSERQQVVRNCLIGRGYRVLN